MHYYFISTLVLLLGPAPRQRRHAKVVQPHQREHAEPDGQRLARADCARDRGAGEHDGGEQGELHAVGLAVADAEATEAVLFAIISPAGVVWLVGGLTRRPTVTPATMEGMEPVRA
jgi:hypothetical protein